MSQPRTEELNSSLTPVEALIPLTSDQMLDTLYPFRKLMMEYQCAMLEIETKLQVLNEQLSLEGERNPIESVHTRLKQVNSIVEKLKRKDLPLTLEAIQENLFDVAGVRVICSFAEDIYRLAEQICLQDDIRFVETKDYIRSPKSNGYRSLHLILKVPVFFAKEKKWIPVEVQFRTIAMDFWASLEHKLRYKKDLPHEVAEQIAQELKHCAEGSHDLDMRMQAINQTIENYSRRTKREDGENDEE